MRPLINYFYVFSLGITTISHWFEEKNLISIPYDFISAQTKPILEHSQRNQIKIQTLELRSADAKLVTKSHLLP